jgi:hypothetical protein
MNTRNIKLIIANTNTNNNNNNNNNNEKQSLIVSLCLLSFLFLKKYNVYAHNIVFVVIIISILMFSFKETIKRS